MLLQGRLMYPFRLSAGTTGAVDLPSPPIYIYTSTHMCCSYNGPDGASTEQYARASPGGLLEPHGLVWYHVTIRKAVTDRPGESRTECGQILVCRGIFLGLLMQHECPNPNGKRPAIPS